MITQGSASNRPMEVVLRITNHLCFDGQCEAAFRSRQGSSFC